MATPKRNQSCPCGSGKKYKHCHGRFQTTVTGAVETREVARVIREMDAKRVQREKQQGFGREIISEEFAGHRVVAVGNRLHFSSQWKTFQDFLRDFLIDQLGREWFQTELARGEDERHPIARWYVQAMEASKSYKKRPGGIISGPMIGAQQAFLNLAYNIYLIAHHAEGGEYSQLLKTFLIKLRSERSDDFIGKLFETYAAAAFLKAGFVLAYEDERDGKSSHVEFVATFPKTGNKFSVEVKSRMRGASDGVKRLRVINKLNKALSKKAEHTRVIFIEVNVPDIITGEWLEGWPKDALDQIRQAEKMKAPDGSEKESAYVVVTNHVFHNNLDAPAIGPQTIAAGLRIADFGPDVSFNRLKDVLDSEDRHSEIFALLDSMQSHYSIPSTFDGEIPELAFDLPSDTPRMKFGQWYLIPDADGREIPGKLYEADVVNKTVYGVYETSDGRHVMCTSPLTEAEFAAWQKHPETFFGEVRPMSKGVKNWLELAKSFFEIYQHTPVELLLGWMKDWPDIDKLRNLPQRELAIIYCERSALAAEMPNAKLT